ncbi:pH-response regulator protein palA/rim20 [Tilletia horrida]|uniref:PH-response regulator protein palA/rim20 n=1 Tax=Tilletia horrida TaxID=155126 RepID=A0AAN6GTG7_9BASI|nr:pH-response regulator protein palA/rim20 [Tilletia horrida]
MSARNLLAVPAKSSKSVTKQLSEAVRSHIAHNHIDAHPDSFKSDIATLCKLRDKCVNLELHQLSIQDATRYYAQLVFVSTKLPDQLEVSFPWSISFPPSMPSWTSSVAASTSALVSSEADSKKAYATASIIAQPSWQYERANILFSLAALHSALGNQEQRGEVESIKRAIKHFETAAGLFSHISENLTGQLRHLRPASPDYNTELLRALKDLMLAQAMECVWQRAVLNSMKDSTIARLAMAVAELYASALEHAEKAKASLNASEGQTGCELPNNWVAHMTVKRWHFAAAAEYRKSCDDLSANRYGDELGRLHVAETSVKKALDASKRSGLSDALKTDLKGLQERIADNIKRGTKDNDLIYLEPVTSASNLPPIAPATDMVKADVPAEVKDPLSFLRETKFGRPLFAELAPLGVHLAISVYEDRKHTFVRDNIARRRDELDGIAASTLNSLGLPGSLQAQEQPMGLPPGLLEHSEKVQGSGGIPALYQLRDDVSRQSEHARVLLDEIRHVLNEEEAEDSGIRTRYSAKIWTRPPSELAARDFRHDLDAHVTVFQQAATSDRHVQEQLEEWEDRIGVLEGGRDSLEANLPKPASGSSSSGSMLQQPQILAARALRKELEDLEDLQFTRAAIVSEASRAETTDDIRPLVLQEAAILSQQVSANGGVSQPLEISAADFESLFEREMKKYSKYAQELNINAQSQEEKLELIEKRNKDFVAARKLDTTAKRRAQALQNMDAAYHKYIELRRHFADGLEFYNQLIRTLSMRRDQVREWAYSRHTDVAQLSSAFANASLGVDEASAGAAQGSPARSSPVKAGGKWGGGQIRFAD